MFEFSFEFLFKKCFWHNLSPVHHISSFLEVDAKNLEKDTNALHLQRMILSDFPSEMVLLQGLQRASRWNISQEADSGTWASNKSQIQAPGLQTLVRGHLILGLSCSSQVQRSARIL